jgi:aquaporin Z
MLKKCLVEFIGTFFLILTVGLSVFSGASGVIPAIAIGFVLMVMVYAGGYISGGHYNPAVSFACAIRGALDWKALIPYWISQALGAVLAALLVTYLVTVTPACEQPKFELLPLIIAELLFTFALCYVVLHTAASPKTEGNSYYGLAIGATVTVGAFATAGLCFGAFNPAVALGLCTMGTACCKIAGITALINIAGGALAGCIYKLTADE